MQRSGTKHVGLIEVDVMKHENVQQIREFQRRVSYSAIACQEVQDARFIGVDTRKIGTRASETHHEAHVAVGRGV